MKFIGIDPGKSGALAVINYFEVLDIIPYDIDMYINALKQYTSDDQYHIYIEQVHAMPGQGVTSMFNFGQSFGILKGILYSLGLRYEEVTPQKWKRTLQVTHDKKSSILRARQLYPEVNLKRTRRSKVDDNNLAEALLLAYYASTR